MVAYNFSARFADAVASGAKRQTIRAPRKSGRHALPGDALQLYTGMRTKQCRKLLEAVCVDASPIVLEAGRVLTVEPLRVDPQELRNIGPHPDIDAFARLDGFDSWEDMRAWFDEAHGLPFQGVLIRW